ncbi:putative zinc finger protein [Orchesella cincta]|uniref:Putative zinc finger protein n=1 Tax=Orchesella cincta TaxID=48709 RepID=A0A1D2M5M6_ORCCI|nr:putative zinc finger protein [Orchesella cincta]
MSSDNLAYCPICGDESLPFTPTRGGSGGTSLFQCFLNLFHAKWKRKSFSFCGLCRSHLVLISDLQKKIEELERQLKSHEEELQRRFSSSEVKFERNKLYEEDRRYSLIRKLIRAKVTFPKPESILPVDDDDLEEELEPPRHKKPFQVEYIKVEVESDSKDNINFDDTSNIKEEIVSEDEKPKEEDEGMMEEDVKPPLDSSSSSSDSELDDDDKPSTSLRKKPQQKSKATPDLSPFTTSVDGSMITFHSITLFKTTNPSSPNEPFGYRCSDCGLLLRNHRQLIRSHVIRAHTTLHACPHCPKRFDKASKLQRHVNESHKKVVTQTCPICERPFKFSTSIDYHIWSHYLWQKRKTELQEHVKEEHSNETSLCGVCGRAIKDLKEHMRATHPPPEKFKFECLICKKKFPLGANSSNI